MNLKEFLEIMDSGAEVPATSGVHQFMHHLEQEVRRIQL